MPKKSFGKTLGSAAILTVCLSVTAWVIVNLGHGFRLWQHGAGHTETVTYLLPKRVWGYGTAPMILIHGNGSRFLGGSMTRYGCFGIATYDLRFYRFDPVTGIAHYAVG